MKFFVLEGEYLVPSAALADEPYTKAGRMRFSRITEFEPVLRQPAIESWCKPA